MVDAQRATIVIPSNLQPSPDVVATRLGDEVVLVQLKTERMHVLNRTGARLWELLCAGRDWADIRDVIIGEFEVTPSRLDAEIEELLTMLRQEQLVRPESEQSE
jgi:hypothetical protein